MTYTVPCANCGSLVEVRSNHRYTADDPVPDTLCQECEEEEMLFEGLLFDVSYCGREVANGTVDTTIVAANYEAAQAEIDRRNREDKLRIWILIGEHEEL